MFKRLLIAFAFTAALLSGAFAQETKTAVFAGGCFWCMQEPFDHVKGVTKTVVGYTGGKQTDANYSDVSAHRTQHRESIQITYDPAQVTYDQLLDVFWRNINPTQADGQFHDIGLSYRTAIYYSDDEQKRAAEESKKKLGESGKFQKPIATEILPATPFYPAEEYHQKYYQKNPREYEAYHVGSGRVSYLEKIWGKDAKP
ncbi:MAG: peptide-methionine (S)-S-oxide reductase MsrA [Verrucomicrobiota bacterium]|nr:peptide-methionine (S)-S-oxide reductase MsrA [Verrucomicrobiota bacterium]